MIKSSSIFFLGVMLFSAIFVSCKNEMDLQVENSLTLSGDNRPELEKVLRHYKDQPLKLKAAKFLIAHMDVHFFYTSEELDEYYEKLHRIFSMNSRTDGMNATQDSLLRELPHPSLNHLSIVPDLQVITADILIDNIDHAFEAWESPYAKELSFEDFCEYLLPYKQGYEKPALWRSSYQDTILKNLRQRLGVDQDYPLEDALAGQEGEKDILQELVWKVREVTPVSTVYTPIFYGGYDPGLLLNTKKGNCYDYSVLSTYIYRSLGIPAGIDFTPQWASRSMGHDWNVLYTTNKKMEDYSSSAHLHPIGTHLQHRKEKKSKIFRETYAKQKGTPGMYSNTEEIPGLFRIPKIKDVTKHYLDCMDVTVDLLFSPPKNKKFAYLCTFDNVDWVPVHWGKIKGKRARFTDMGKGVVYIPMYFHYNRLLPAANPFILSEEGKVVILTPDTLHTQQLILTRKYTPSNVEGEGKQLMGSRFQVANEKDFSDSLTVHVVKDEPEVRYNYVNLNLKKAYRYFRFLAPKGSHGGGMAEMDVFGDESGTKLTGDIIGNGHCRHGSRLEYVFDGDPLTFYQTHHPDWGEAGLAFHKEEYVSGFRFLPPNDDNFIWEGDEYELFYWNNNRWNSLGKQTGTRSQYLEYNNAPLNALFWLRNLTKGKEERIFTYENGKQVWW